MEWLDTSANIDYSNNMPLRILPLVNGEYYHVYNRGVALQPTYASKKDYDRFILSLLYYRFNNLPFKLSRLLQISEVERESIMTSLKTANNKTVDLIAFCLMPNHFHILLQQKFEGGISKFMKQVTDSYTRYFNTRHNRVGPLFQGAFKAVRVENDDQLIHLSRYIHLNPLVSYIVREADFTDYPWSSLKNYINDDFQLINPEIVLSNFKSPQDYLTFVRDQINYGKELEKIKHLALEA